MLITDGIFKKLNWTKLKINGGNKYLNNLRFEDDIFIETSGELHHMTEDLNKEKLKVGLNMKKKKAKVMVKGLAYIEVIAIQGKTSYTGEST